MGMLANLKFLLAAIVLIIAFQSCSIYRSKTMNADEAVAFNRKVKIKTSDSKTYKFKSLENDEHGLVGITRPNSIAGKKLKADVVETNYLRKFVKIKLDEEEIEQIKPKDYLGSFFVVLGVALAVTTAIIASIASLLVIGL